MKYGYPRLGTLNAFLRDCIGDEALLELKSQSVNAFNDFDKKRIKKELDRLCNENSDDYTKFRFDENELILLVRTYFSRFQMGNNFIEAIGICLIQFCQNFYGELRRKDSNGSLLELETRKYALLSINQTVNLIVIPKYCEKIGEKATQEQIRFYLGKDFSYKTLFDTLLSRRNFPSLNKYIESLQSSFDNEKSKYDNKLSSFHDCIASAYKENKNPTWRRFQFILKYCPVELQNDFFCTYILNNIKLALQNNFNLTEEDFQKIHKDLNSFTETEPIGQIRQSLEIVELIQMYCRRTFVEFEYKKTGTESYYRSLEEIERKAPYTSKFFIPWFKGFVCVAQKFYDEARNWFEQAFDYYQFAGNYISKFIEMAFSFELYFTDWSNTRKAIIGQQNKSPVTKYAKMYWNFGYAIGLFDKKADDTFLEAYKPVLNFYTYFPNACFINSIKANNNELMSEMGCITTSKETFLKNPYQVLSALKTSYNRNKLISFFECIGDNTAIENKNQKRLYTPLALCLQLGRMDDRLWDLANEWLDDTENPVDVDKLCFNGSTALHEALTQYANIRLHSSETTDRQKKLRAVTSKLIDRATYLGETKRETQIHTLQVAIHSYDVDFVKRIADKIPDEEFQQYRISADEASPLYYVLLRRRPLFRGKEKYLKNLEENKENVNWKNLAFPGYTESEKRKSLESFLSSTKDILPPSLDFQYGFATKDAQLKAFDEIIDYFISRTKDVDSFVFHVPHDDRQQGTTALFYAAEFDDAKTCRKLITAGADITKQIGTVYFFSPRGRMSFPNSFIYRVIHYKSWETLRMFLTEFKDKAHLVMHKDNSDITPLVYFISLMKYDTSRFPAMYLLAEFIQLFQEAGASLTESTELGCAEFLLSH